MLGWSQRYVAELLRCNERRARDWATGFASIPAGVADWLDARARSAEALPPPTDWRQKRGRPRRAQAAD